MRETNTKPNRTLFKRGHKKVGGFVKGSKHKQNSKTKISQSLIGKFGKESRRWKGDAAGYVAKHLWIIKHYGKANRCENKACTYPYKPKRYEWHNIDKKYSRNREDYIQLCCSCHKRLHRGSIKVIK